MRLDSTRLIPRQAARLRRDLRTLLPGLLVAGVIAMGAAFLSTSYGGPLMLFALLLGMALHFLAEEESCLPGIEFAAGTVLRIGVALLGARITFDQVSGIGWLPLLIVAASVVLVILLGWVGARLLGLRPTLGVLSGGAVAICGASAAAALAAVLPKNRSSNRDTGFTVIGVTVLSTTAMVLYPGIGLLVELDDAGAGFFLGATIHDVAQVVGAGYSVSPEAGNAATVVKLFRVALLVPVVLAVSALYGRRAADDDGAGVRVPPFLIAFVVLVCINSFGVIPAPAVDALNHVSRACLAIAIAAIGVRTSLQEIRKLGLRPIVLILSETVVLAAIGLATAVFLMPANE